MNAAKKLRERLEKREVTVGVLISFHLWLDAVDMAIDAGMDYVIVDCEHLNHSADVAADCCAFGRRVDFPVLFRPANADAASIRVAADLGPCGFLLPVIEQPSQLDEVRDGLYMPPRGQRRPGGRGNRWVSGINYENFKSEFEDDFICLPQIETPLGLANAEAIAKHELTTALAIGPYDLSARFGVCWQPDHPKLVEARSTLRRAAEAAGKAMWMLGDPAQLVKDGYHFICAGEVSMLLQAALRRMVEQGRGLS